MMFVVMAKYKIKMTKMDHKNVKFIYKVYLTVRKRFVNTGTDVYCRKQQKKAVPKKIRKKLPAKISVPLTR